MLLELVIVLSIAVFLYKLVLNKDLSLMGSILLRIYLLAIVIGILNDTIEFGLLLMLTADLISSFVYFFTIGFREKTKQRELLDAIDSLNRKYHVITNSSFMAVYVLDRKGNFISVNKRAEEITGYTKEELEKMKCYDIIVKSQQDKIKDSISYRIKNGIVDSITTVVDLVRKDGNIVTVECVSAVTKNGQITITGIARPLKE
jgi:PAS domain S-box-containing protein